MFLFRPSAWPKGSVSSHSNIPPPLRGPQHEFLARDELIRLFHMRPECKLIYVPRDARSSS